MTPVRPVKIVIVDDHPMLRLGVAQLLELEEDLTVIAQLTSAADALREIPNLNPDLVLLDLNLPDMSGASIINKLRTEGVEPRILVFSVSDDHNDIYKAACLGADGYLLKDMEPELLLDAIRRCANGERVVSGEVRDVFRVALEEWLPDNIDPHIKDLTEREKDVLRLITKGFSNKLIAQNLDIAEGTVKVHVKRLLSKLKMKSRMEAAIFALDHDIDL